MKTTTATDAVLDLVARWRRPDDSDLAAEYERLFVGPGRVPCGPYESLWRADVPARLQGTLLGPCVADLENCYAGLGLRVAQDAAELPDHIAVELEAVAVAVAHPDSSPIARALVADHLAKWVRPFCSAVIQHAESDYFRTLATDTARQVDELEAVVRPRDE